jgi:unsaturated chondroitin disaccharide hydrolase
MNKFLLLFLIGVIFIACSDKGEEIKKQELINSISSQLKVLTANIPPDKVPRSFQEKVGYKFVDKHDWTCGFTAGTFWYMNELSGDEYWEKVAIENTKKLDSVQFISNTHDLGFMVFCSYGNAYRLTGKTEYKEVIIQASETLIKRFNPKIGCIKSWDWSKWQFPVIIDNMMNLEILFWASNETGNPKYKNIAITHANTTLKNHFRGDMSSFHVLDYDTTTGNPVAKQTYQGINDNSAWGRGQAWGLYGFTVCYRETNQKDYLGASERIADYIIKNLPGDYISYWDYNDPKIPNTYRDVSAAAITASALFELSRYSKKGAKYFNVANRIIVSLSSERYRAKQGENGGFILRHSVGNLPGNGEIDVAINYADYYYLEALKRKYELLNQNKK